MGAAEVVRYVTRHGARRIDRIVLSGTVTPMLPRSADNPDGIPAGAAAHARAIMTCDIGDWMEMSGKAEYFYGEHPVSQQLRSWARTSDRSSAASRFRPWSFTAPPTLQRRSTSPVARPQL